MPNQKYDNLTELLEAKTLNWNTDVIEGILVTGATFDPAHVRFSELGTPSKLRSPIPGRSVSPDGDLLGWPVSFHRVQKDIVFQLVVVKNDGSNNPLVLAFYGADEGDDPLTLKYTGTLIVRPLIVEDPDPPVLGVWVQGS